MVNATVKQNVAVVSGPPVQALRFGPESCGGVLDSIAAVDGKPPVLRFWID